MPGELEWKIKDGNQNPLNDNMQPQTQEHSAKSQYSSIKVEILPAGVSLRTTQLSYQKISGYSWWA